MCAFLIIMKYLRSVLFAGLVQGLLNPKAMARLSLGEALTNLVWAKVTSLTIGVLLWKDNMD